MGKYMSDKDLPVDDRLNLENIKRLAEKMFADANGSHDWDHTLRVCKLCERIGPKEGADMTVLLIAAYFHDIGRRFQDDARGEICHAEKGAEMSMPIVSTLPISKRQQDKIIDCIRTHRFRGDNTPETIEAKVLFDADKLDAIGAVGVARAYLFAGEVGARLHNPDIDIKNTRPYTENDTGFREYKVKLCRISECILTETGKEIAAGRHAFMEYFFKQFLDEYDGRK
ncbi:MAG: HD domain-containing protein [Desulfobacterales bacterium]|nr:HD domain-containing protein [Desulfobacterales bacterium]